MQPNDIAWKFEEFYNAATLVQAEDVSRNLDGCLYFATQYPGDNLLFSEPELMPGKTGAFTLVNKADKGKKYISFATTVDVDLFDDVDSSLLEQGRVWTGFVKCNAANLQKLLRRMPLLTISVDKKMKELLAHYGNLGIEAGVTECAEHTIIFISDSKDITDVKYASPHFRILDSSTYMADSDFPAQPPEFCGNKSGDEEDNLNEIVLLLRKAGAIIAENYCVFVTN